MTVAALLTKRVDTLHGDGCSAYVCARCIAKAGVKSEVLRERCQQEIDGTRFTRTFGSISLASMKNCAAAVQ